MPLSKPYRRIYRPNKDVSRFAADYVDDPRYASDRANYLRAYRLLEQHLLSTFDFVEPSDDNLKTYSHQFYQLLLRACTEFEANAKAILRANNYSSPRNLNISDYQKIQKACRLSEYVVTIPAWAGAASQLRPFGQWQGSSSLSWYQAYNSVKHDRSQNFLLSNFENVLDSVAAVLVILFAQFDIVAFDPYHEVGMYSTADVGRLAHPSCFLLIEPPKAWTSDEQYDFDWESLKEQSDPFQVYPF